MQSDQARRRWLLAARITPLTMVILGSLTWSSYSTFEYAVLLGVPAFIAWTLPLALDGTVAVTTPIWLSTVEERSERNYAAIVCTFALLASMAVNVAESGWIGIFPPLIAYLLIHLVGRVLRAGARRMRAAQLDTTPETVVGSVVVVPDVVAAPEPVEVVEIAPVVPEPVTVSEAPAEPVSEPVPAQLTVLPRRFASGADMARHLLEEADGDIGGAEITRALRDAGFEVNDNYGRSAKSRWSAARDEVAV